MNLLSESTVPYFQHADVLLDPFELLTELHNQMVLVHDFLDVFLANFLPLMPQLLHKLSCVQQACRGVAFISRNILVVFTVAGFRFFDFFSQVLYSLLLLYNRTQSALAKGSQFLQEFALLGLENVETLQRRNDFPRAVDRGEDEFLASAMLRRLHYNGAWSLRDVGGRVVDV